MARSTRTLRPVDDVWLQLDHPDNLMVVESLLLLDGVLDRDSLRTLVRERVVDRFPVFRQRPVPGSWTSTRRSWEDDPDFDLDRHVVECTLDPPGDDAALADLVAGLLSRAIDRHHPLWEVHLVHGHRGGSAVYSRLHHAMADGMALTRVALSLTDPAPPPEREPEPAPIGIVPEPEREPVDPGWVSTLVESARGVLRTTVGSAPVLTRLTLARHPVGPLAATPHHAKRAVWAVPVPLETITAIREQTGATVTDVAVAALTGALRTWLLERGADTTTDVATMVPVDVRRPGAPLPPELGNRFALVLLDLPVGVGTPLGRLSVVRTRTSEIKQSPEAQVTYAMLQTMGLTVPFARRFLTGYFAGKAVGVTTSVHGPDEPMWLAGRRVSRMLGWAPVSGDQTLSTCIVGYDGHLDVGFKVDLAAVPDPETLVAAFAAEVEALRLATSGA